mmetsp:Transcript_78635/g.138654  ORF Transcript_78635/g.138654 Transcript_78635/m.138654 type:complete len:410 (+) Transcript_78635:94-1323(+)|eukprot:CAMPEP_0197635006 /NCGR_PEP_ID=MMETSP1338-20131121/10944_1 /TAXON_ID=43686 ORGANISM="Pelagodinium beii, Strain RCC1491" /NCGR_SAMPLE_ID=MMETSP1338 /ASSEMBLY_ACC=CAM_ASM_000754 /LENGTH=409 /DNA_ID=CAMNT_0043206979 /DNA_START=37 /DNA_END=1266 /DNA_ORIENTATION=-
MATQIAFVALCLVLGQAEVPLRRHVRKEGYEAGIEGNGNVQASLLSAKNEPHSAAESSKAGKAGTGIRTEDSSKQKQSKEDAKEISETDAAENSRESEAPSHTTGEEVNTEQSPQEAVGLALKTSSEEAQSRSSGAENETEDIAPPTEATPLQPLDNSQLNASASVMKHKVLNDDPTKETRSADAPIRRKEVDPEADKDNSKKGHASATDGDSQATDDDQDAKSGDQFSDGDSDDTDSLRQKEAVNEKQDASPAELSMRKQGKKKRETHQSDQKPETAEAQALSEANEVTASTLQATETERMGEDSRDEEDAAVKEHSEDQEDLLHEDVDPRLAGTEHFALYQSQRFYSKDIRDIQVQNHGILVESTQEQTELREKQEDSKSGLAAIFSPSFGKHTKTLAQAKAGKQQI